MSTLLDRDLLVNGAIISADGLTGTTSRGTQTIRATANKITASKGKWYWEVTSLSPSSSALVGVIDASVNLGANNLSNANSRWMYFYNGTLWGGGKGGSGYGLGINNNDTVGCLLDLDNGTLSYTINGVNRGIAFTNMNLSAQWYPATSNGSSIVSVTKFAFLKSEFKYPIPVGYKAFDVVSQYSLIFNNGEYKKWNGLVWEVVSTTKPTALDFSTSGMESLSPLLDRLNGVSPLDQLTGNFDVVTWTDKNNIKSTDVLKLNVKASPHPQLVIPIGDISLVGIESVDSISLISTGDVKIAVSFDRGVTWKAFKGGAWVSVASAHDGMTNLELNSLTSNEIELGREGESHIRFSYSLSDGAEVDNIEIKVSLQGYEQIAPSSSYDMTYDQGDSKIIYTAKRNISASANYVDSQ